MSKINLNGSWSGICLLENGKTDFTFEGSVPGCVHADLMGTKIPQNIYYRDNADNYFSLLPGEVRTIKMRPAAFAETKEIKLTAYTVKL